MLKATPLDVTDFSGGITDHYVNAPLNRAQELDNFTILPNKSIISRSGSHIDDSTNTPQIPVGLQRINTLINYNRNDKLFVHSSKKIYYRDPATYSTLQGPSTNDVWSLATTANHMAHTQWKEHIFLTNDSFDTPKKVFKDSGGIYQLRTAGLPALASNPTIVPSVAGARTYLYAFLYFYEYTAGQQTFQDFGPTTVIEVLNADAPETNQIDLSNIPVISNGLTESYDTATIKVHIYRTIDGGSTLYKLGEVVNGITVFTDSIADSVISNNSTIYTNSGTLDNDPPPLAKYVHIVNNTGYYAYTKEGTDILPMDIRQSVPNDPDSCPGSLRDTVEDEIKGLNSIQSVPIVLCRNHIYRLEGLFDAQGRGSVRHVRIHDTAGCVSNNSVIQVENNLFWAGNDGFYASDGYKVLHISDHLNDRYKAMLEAMSDHENISATYDEKNGLVYWAVQLDSASGDNDACFILDLRWGLGANSSFTTMSGGDSFAPTALTYKDRELYRADKRGYVFIHSSVDENDPKINTALAPTLWESQSVTWLYKGFSTNFGSDFLRKWVPRMIVAARNVTNVTIGLTAINDDGKATREITPIRYRGNFIWGDPEFVWGEASFRWDSAGLIQQLRRLPKGGLRCSYMQIQITNALANVTNSDNLGTATVDNVASTATLDSAAVADWPIDSVDYYIAFEVDNYTKEYLITGRTNDTITFLDTTIAAPSGSQKWILKGIRKGEVLNLLGYTLVYAPLSQTQGMFEAGQAGANA